MQKPKKYAWSFLKNSYDNYIIFFFFMQKTSFFSLILRGAIIGLSAAVVFFTSVYAVAFAADNTNNGGRFWEILNKILVGKWDDSRNDGTVKNAEKLGGRDAKDFQKILGGAQKCPINQCVVGFNDETGDIICQ